MSESPQTIRTKCCVVGGGPAGVMLSFLLARKGVPVTLLEAHKDFDREFRGDTLHPPTMELMDQLGLADALLEQPHTKIHTAQVQTATGTTAVAEFGRLKTRFPYIVLMPQSCFLEFVTREAARFPNFTLNMEANVRELVEHGGAYGGVRYLTPQGCRECHASLTVACDGRFSRLRQLVGPNVVRTSPPMDVLWFRLPREPSDGVDLTFRVDGGRVAIMFDRGDHWQIGFVILKGTFHDIRERGLESFRAGLARLIPELTNRVDRMTDWKQITPLNVEANRLKQWYLPGLLFLGDAAHVMSPVGGVGINYAIQDAVEASNVLTEPLKEGAVKTAHLARIQRKREFPTRAIQLFQTTVQQRAVKTSLNPEIPFRPPWFLKLAFVRRLAARIIAFGIGRSHLKS